MFFVNMKLTIICKKAVIENSRVLEIFSDQSVTPIFFEDFDNDNDKLSAWFNAYK